MRFRRDVVLLLVLGLVLPGVRGSEFLLFKNVWGNVIVATDTTIAGKELIPPTPDKPAYYKGISLGRKLGSIPGDHEPNEKELNRFVANVLAKQGYLSAEPGGEEPSLLLVVQWGFMEPRSGDLLWFLGYDPEKDIGAPVMAGMIGAEVFRTGFRSQAIDTILSDAKAPIYGIIVTAFEFKTAKTPTPVIYWQTRIGLPANGKSMATALPTMLVAAGPAIGRATDSPVLLDADNARQGTVTFGELKFSDVVPEPARSGTSR